MVTQMMGTTTYPPSGICSLFAESQKESSIALYSSLYVDELTASESVLAVEEPALALSGRGSSLRNSGWYPPSVLEDGKRSFIVGLDCPIDESLETSLETDSLGSELPALEDWLCIPPPAQAAEARANEQIPDAKALVSVMVSPFGCNTLFVASSVPAICPAG